jgi:uncharacterized membrane protein
LTYIAPEISSFDKIVLATFLFVLLTFVVLRREAEHQFIPRITTLTCVLLVITSFGMLVAYNHRVANSIQTNDAVAEIVDDLVNVLGELRTQREDSADVSGRAATSVEEKEKTEILARLAAVPAPILARRSGYLQMIARKELLEAAVRYNMVMEILFLPGQFISEGDVIARVSPAERVESFTEVLLRGIVVGANRTLQQDVEFALAQLVEVALRALSPAINDTFTGLTCIGWLGDAIRILATLPPSEGISYGSDGRIRLIERPLRFSQVVKSAFDQIRQAGTDNPAVMIRLLRTWGRMAPQLDASQREVLLEQVESIHELASRQVFSRSDNAEIDAEYQAARDLLTGKTAINL